MKFSWKQNICALGAALIWGTAFVAQSVSADLIEPLTFNALRSVVAVLVLGGFLLARGFFRRRKGNCSSGKAGELWLGGLVCGLFLFAAANLQQWGIGGSGAGKSGFITALYIVIVPLLGMLFRKKVSLTVWIAVIIAVVGLYFLCVSEGFSVATSDIALLLCALAFACQILAVDHFSKKVDPVSLSFAQFVVVSACSLVGALLFEGPSVEAVGACIWPILYVGVFSSGVAYTLQIFAQKGSDPTVISLLLSLEAFFSVVAGGVLLAEVLTLREYAGCALMLCAVIVVHLPGQKRRVA